MLCNRKQGKKKGSIATFFINIECGCCYTVRRFKPNKPISARANITIEAGSGI